MARHDRRRLCPERDLPRTAYRPGRGTPRPQLPAVGDDPTPSSQALRYGFDLLNHGFPWEAHEVWEGAWHVARQSDPEAAALLQALIQVAAARVLARDGRLAGARRVAGRAAIHLARAGGAIERYGLDRSALDAAAALAGDPCAAPIVLIPSRAE